MRVLLATGASYEPPRGGSTRANRVWMEGLAARGHECRVVCASDSSGVAGAGGVRVHCVGDPGALRAELTAQIREFHPDKILISSEDLGQALLAAALEHDPATVVYLAHTPQMFPFGPASLHPNRAGLDAVRAAAQVIAIGRYTADVIEQHTGRRPDVVHPPMYPPPPYPDMSSPAAGAIGLINPCAVKGVSLFVELARHFPRLHFAALHGWGTTRTDTALLASVPNIEPVPPVRDINDFFRRIRLLLVPSLWHEGFGLVVTEAMLRGIPVVASDLGGLPEAKLGVPHLAPVRPIERYRTEFDELRMPVPLVPEQDLEPWASALERLTQDPAHYAEIAGRSRTAAAHFVRGLDPADFERVLAGRMRLLLVQNSQYFPAFGGGNKSNRLLMEALAADGHRCLVVTRAEGAGFTAELDRRQIAYKNIDGSVSFCLNGVEVETETDPSAARERWAETIREYSPTWTFISSDDPALTFAATALEESAGRVVYLARTTLALPFGPDGAFESREKTELLGRMAGVAGVSEYVAAYVTRYGGVPAVHVPIALEGKGPFPALGSFEAGYITLVNPCAIKGLPIFVELARRCPDLPFAAVPTWGTTEQDLNQLRALPNVTILPPSDNIDEILRQTRVILVPSLWAEARSRMVLEALLRGVPVLAARSGGIPEAMMGLDYLLPVNPILRYKPQLDEQMVPVPDVPPQDVAPWEQALRELLSDPIRYESLAAESKRRAEEYVNSISVVPLVEYLRTLKPRWRRTAPAEPHAKRSAIDALSPEKRALLASRLRERRVAAAVQPAPAIISPDSVPLSYAQERMVRLHSRDAVLFNVPLARRIASDRVLIASALDRLVERHHSLRTGIDNGRQRIHERAALPLSESPARVDEPFALDRPPLARASFTGGLLTVVVHHAIADGWSSSILARELAGAGGVPAMQYPEWTLWQRRQVESGAWEAQRRFWTAQLQGFQAPEPQDFSGAWLRRALPGSGRLFADLLERWAGVLLEWLGLDEVVIAVPVANRRLSAIENTVGMFVNTLPVRCRRGQAVKPALEAAFANQDFPFEALRVPMPRYLFVVHPAPDSGVVDMDTARSEYDVRLSVAGQQANLQFRTGAVSPAIASELLDRFLATVAG